MDDAIKLAIVAGGYARVLCEAPLNADVEPGDTVIFERNDTQVVGTVINTIALTGAQGRAISDFIADWLDFTRPYSRIIGAVQMFDWSSEAVDDGGTDGDDGNADEAADTAEDACEEQPERGQGADAANSMDTGGANPIYRKQPCAYAHTCMYAKTCGMPDKCTHRDTADGIGNATVVPDGYKRCDTCRQVKPLSYFVRGNGADGKGDTCMKCARARNREAREALDEFNRNGGNTR